VKVVVVGLGVQGRKRRAVAGADVVATVDPVVPEADVRDLDAVPADAYQAALVCVPDAAKLPLLRRLLSQGKHVLVEKPLLSPDPEPLRELAALARTAGAVCYTAYNHRFEPHIARMKDVLDAGALGRVYHARMFYGNGTAMDVRQSPWRDSATGVIADLGSHLLDTALFLFGTPAGKLDVWAANAFENRAFDHVIMGGGGRPTLELEATLLSWRNTFTLDVFAEDGTAHIHGLCKWGPSVFTLRRRVRPSGRPPMEAVTLDQPDPTWSAEYAYFTALCARRGDGNLANDAWINGILSDLARSAGRELLA
jgi:predicted dehydrogenase